MYTLVLMTALVAGEPAGGLYYYGGGVVWGCECGLPALPRGGVVNFYWQGPEALSEAEEKEWADYVAALDEFEKGEVIDLWKKADRSGKQKLLAQVRAMRPAKPDPAKNGKDKDAPKD